MALQCNITLNYANYSAGQNPPPMATLSVYNPNAVAVTVTGMQLNARALGDTPGHTSMYPGVMPIGPGMTVTAAALSSINIGPFPVVLATAANANSFQAVNQTGNLNPINPQGSQPPQVTIVIGADVQGSDGSFNVAGTAALVVSYQSQPPLGFQGGFLALGNGNNLANLRMLGIL